MRYQNANKTFAELTCPYCGVNQVHNVAHLSHESHSCYHCQRVFVTVSHIEVLRVQNEVTRFKRAA